MPGKNYLPVIFLNSASAGGAWLLSGNAGTNPATDCLGTTDNVTLTFRVSNTVALRIVPAYDPNLFPFAPNIIGGSSANTVAPGVYGATIAGGGGMANTASNIYATIGGGNGNIASGEWATVGGGNQNTASGTLADVGGYATIGGGYQNVASGDRSTIGGGSQNIAGGLYATVPGGYDNFASGRSSFAAGQYANTNNRDGAFVWGDASGTTYISATVPNEFLVRASGGITMYTNSAATVGVQVAPGSGSWSSVSDKNLKANFMTVDSRAFLEQVDALPITTWNYTTQDASVRRIGPMAQDFASAFKVGENDTTISTVDAQGVALAAIQGLVHENQDLKAQVASLQSQNDAQQKVNASLDARLTAIEQANRQSPNAFAWNNLRLWGIVGLLALLVVRKRKS